MKLFLLALCISTAYSLNNVENPVDISSASKFLQEIDPFNEVAPHSFPFTVMIQIHQNNVWVNNCAGVILRSNRVLTTAQCLRNATAVTVIAGVHNRDRVEPNQQRRNVPASSFNIHPHYDNNRLNNVAILNVATPFTLNTVVAQAILPNSVDEETFEGQTARTLSWARISGETLSSSVLRSLTNTVISNTECERFFVPGFVFHSTICVASSTQNRNFCGTSVLTAERGGSIVIGLSDFVPPGCEVGRPFGFVRLSSFVTWINSQL
ncbi:brachyurin-like [Chironomus tepperi]|uniref:brachyurin-like n=1 Tax=Chironomus tepperi TaxID=113505 RepID=UPI00391F250F